MRAGNIVIWRGVANKNAAKYLVIGSPIEPAIYKPPRPDMSINYYDSSKDYLILSLNNNVWNQYVIKEFELEMWQVVV